MVFQKRLSDVIEHFLNCTCRLTPQWFNKPKFHVILHLPGHIRRFGPAMLFATEGFESFNAIIRSCSIHSNRHAPSHDIALRMAKSNRVRHLLSGGFFLDNHHRDDESPEDSNGSPLPNWRVGPHQLKARWTTAATAPLELLEISSFGDRLLKLTVPKDNSTPGKYEFIPDCIYIDTFIVTTYTGQSEKLGRYIKWSETLAALAQTSNLHSRDTLVAEYRISDAVTLLDGSKCRLNDWVLWRYGNSYRLGQVVEIFVRSGSNNEMMGLVDGITVLPALVGETHERYLMPKLTLLREYAVLEVQVSRSLIGVHDII